MRLLAFVRIILPLCVCATPVAASAQTTYNPATVFEHGFTAKTNPNNPWSYGYSTSLTGAVTLFNTTADGSSPATEQLWLSSTVNSENSPSVAYNNGPAYSNGNVNFLADQVILVAGVGGQYADLVFTAPAAGLYSVASTFRGDQANIGTVVGVIAAGKVLFNSKVSSEGQTVPYNANIYLTSGEKVVFSAGPDGGLQNTGLTLSIATVPCSLADTLSYASTTGTLTMAFTLSTSAPVTWNAWITSDNSIQELFSVNQPATPNPTVIKKTFGISKRGTVGVLSTLTNPTQGIVCSSFSTASTGTP